MQNHINHLVHNIIALLYSLILFTPKICICAFGATERAKSSSQALNFGLLFSLLILISHKLVVRFFSLVAKLIFSKIIKYGVIQPYGVPTESTFCWVSGEKDHINFSLLKTKWKVLFFIEHLCNRPKEIICNSIVIFKLLLIIHKRRLDSRFLGGSCISPV